MAKKASTINIDETPTELIIPRAEFTRILDERIAIGDDLHNRSIAHQNELQKNQEDFSNWNDYNSEYLKHAFNKEQNEYKKKYDNAGTFYFGIMGGPQSPDEKIQEFKGKVYSKLDNLKKLRAKTDLLKSSNHQSSVITEKPTALDKSQIFIVHGHDEAAKAKTARFIEKLGLKPIILHEQASASRTVIEKIEAYSNVGFGIVLYTACDLGAKAEEHLNLKNRARQNVVFEHGYLIGKIGRENVCALVKGEIETPNDISGVVYVKMDDDDAWHLKVARELRNSGYEIDMNKL